MANRFVDSYRKILVGDSSVGLVDWNADTMRGALLDTGAVTPNTATHDFWDDWVAGIVGTKTTLPSVTYPSAGTVTCGAITFVAVSGATAEALAIFKDTGVNSTSPLVALYDTFAAGMPVTPNGGDIVVTPHASGLVQVAG